MRKELAHCCIAQGTLLNVIRLPGWEGSLGKNGYLECMAEFLSCSLETVTTLLISCTPIQNKLKKKKKESKELVQVRGGLLFSLALLVPLRQFHVWPPWTLSLRFLLFSGQVV